ncbi:hypothetical protein H0H93_012340, partial [Arthromyces matolae]
MCALILADIFSVAARPLPLPGSGLVPRESFDAIIPSTDDVNVSFAMIHSNEGRGIAARNTSDGDDEPHAVPSASRKRDAEKHRKDPMTIPHEFLPKESPPLKIILPRAQNLNLSGWGSVLNILNLINAMADLDGTLKKSGVIFKAALEQALPMSPVDRYIRELKKMRPTALVLEETKNLDLDGLRNAIQKAIQLHNDFEGEIMIPKGFLEGSTALAIKVPYKNGKEEAVASLRNILTLMRLATVGETALSTRLKNLRRALKERFGFDFPSETRTRKPVLDATQFLMRGYILKVVKRHNAGEWMKKEDIEKWNQDTLIVEDLPPVEEVPRRRHFFQIPSSFFVPVKGKTKTITMSIPSSDDIEGLKRVDEILTLMAKVDGTDALKESWRRVRKRLAVDFQLRVMETPETWGTEADQETKEKRKEAVVDAITRHNGIQKENNAMKRKR